MLYWARLTIAFSFVAATTGHAYAGILRTDQGAHEAELANWSSMAPTQGPGDYFESEDSPDNGMSAPSETLASTSGIGLTPMPADIHFPVPTLVVRCSGQLSTLYSNPPPDSRLRPPRTFL